MNLLREPARTARSNSARRGRWISVERAPAASRRFPWDRLARRSTGGHYGRDRSAIRNGCDRGTVDTVEPLGEYTIVNVAVADQIVNAKVSSTSVDREDRVYLTFDDDDAYLYDENGELLS